MVYYLLKLYKYAALGVVGLMGLLCLIGIMRLGSWSAVKNKVTSRRHGQHMGMWALLLAVVLMVNLFVSYLNAGTYSSADIVLNYNKASSGLNPNGTRYNATDILCDAVLEDAIARGALQGVTAEDLRASLSANSAIQGNSYNKNGYFISTQYELWYNATKKTIGFDPENLVTLVAESYKRWFIDQYSDNDSVLMTDIIDFSDKDYLDICDYLKARAEMVYKYMSRLDAQESVFTSSKIDETFKSVANQAGNIENVMIEKLRAYVLENGISKDRDAYVGRLGFENVTKYFSELDEAAKNRNALTAISMYEDDMARIVLVPTYDKNDQFYMSETRIGIDDFAELAQEYANNKNRIRNTIATNNHVMSQLMRNPNAYGKDEKAEALVSQILTELNRVSESARIIAGEYREWEANGYVVVDVTEKDDKIKDIIVRTLEYTMMMMLSFAAVQVICGKDKKEKNAAADKKDE